MLCRQNLEDKIHVNVGKCRHAVLAGSSKEWGGFCFWDSACIEDDQYVERKYVYIILPIKARSSVSRRASCGGGLTWMWSVWGRREPRGIMRVISIPKGVGQGGGGGVL